MTTQTFITDGQRAHAVKSFDLDEYPPEAWTWYSGAPTRTQSEVYRTLPWLYRAIGLVAGGVTQVPWTIYNSRGDEITNSTDFVDPTGILSDPWGLLRILSMSLDLNGQAYVLKKRNRARTLELRYLAASTITVEIDPVTGEPKFKRSVNSMTVDLTPADLMYFWLPDPDVEAGPPQAWPALTAKRAAGVLSNLDTFAASYFERGAVRPMVVSVSGNPNREERERIETWFQRLFSGIKNAFRMKVFNADKISVQSIGDGLDQLRDVALTEQKRQDISAALGIPFAMLFSEAANYATAQEDSKRFYSETVLPRMDLLCDVFNQQLLVPLGYKIVPNPDALDVFREDENSRAGAVGQYVSAGMPLLMALDILGVDLTDEQRAELEEMQEEPEPEQAPPQAPTPSPAMEQEPAETPEVEAAEEDAEALAEMKRWRRAALQALRKGKPLPVLWIPEAIDAHRADAIKAALGQAVTAEQVAEAFDGRKMTAYPETLDGAGGYIVPAEISGALRNSGTIVGKPVAVRGGYYGPVIGDTSDLPDLAAELRRANDLLEAVAGDNR